MKCMPFSLLRERRLAGRRADPFAAEPSVYERFEGSLAGEREGGVSFSDAAVALAESQGSSRQSGFFDISCPLLP